MVKAGVLLLKRFFRKRSGCFWKAPQEAFRHSRVCVGLAGRRGLALSWES